MNQRTRAQLAATSGKIRAAARMASEAAEDRALTQVFQGTREWKVLALAVRALWPGGWEEQISGLMEQLPGAVLRRAKGESVSCGSEACTTSAFVDLVARPPSEPIAKELRDLIEQARSRSQREEDPFLALADAFLVATIHGDSGLKKIRKACWRQSGPGWRLSKAVAKAVADSPRNSGCQAALDELNSVDMFDNRGVWLSPAVVLNDGQLVRFMDHDRPPVDVAALRAQQEIQDRDYADARRRIFGRTRSEQVKRGQQGPSGSC